MALKIGIVGLGIMGGAFARNLLDGGFEITGCDTLQARADEVAARGGAIAATPRAVAEASDIVITSLPTLAALHDVMTGEHGISHSGKKGLIVVECSTMPIDDKQACHDALAKAGITLLDCPISGTGSQAQTKDLAIYASGDKKAYEKCIPVFEGFGRVHVHVGPFGHGSKLKFIANHLVQIHNVASAEAMVLGMKAGLDPQIIVDVISQGAGTSRVFELRAPMMVENNYDQATMKTAVWKKDMEVIGAFAAELECPVPLFSACTELFRAALAAGYGPEDVAAVCKVLEQMAQLER